METHSQTLFLWEVEARAGGSLLMFTDVGILGCVWGAFDRAETSTTNSLLYGFVAARENRPGWITATSPPSDSAPQRPWNLESTSRQKM